MKTILIVDDDQLLLQGLKKALGNGVSKEITEVLTAETGREALEKIAASSCCLCLLDIFLPDMEGTEVVKILKTISPETKVIMMSAGVIDAVMQENIEKNAVMFLPKPFDLRQLRMLVKGIVEETQNS